MTMLAIHSPAAVSTTTPPPVGPPTSGSPVGTPPGAVPPPATPTTPPRPPLTGISSTLVVDLTEASRLVGRAVEMLDTVPRDDVGAEATKDLRVRIFKTNMAAQSRIEKQLTGNPDSVVSELRKVDAYLEDSNWQVAKKPSPDGRFNGVDIPGAVRDAHEGARVLDELLVAAGGTPSNPSTPPPAGPPGAPPLPPTTPTTPPGTVPVPAPDEPSTPPPSNPPAGPPGGTPPGVPGGGSPDPGYPGEDEFPTDDKILNGGDS